MKDFVDEVDEALGRVRAMLLEKNKKYGDSALRPIQCFSKLSPVEGLNVRLDDKIKRLYTKSTDDDEDVELDIMGYLVLKQILLNRVGARESKVIIREVNPARHKKMTASGAGYS